MSGCECKPDVKRKRAREAQARQGAASREARSLKEGRSS